jgi:NAD(P)-dependent dehydrogenase (short-subunit alcohol dehydrogenase family)
MSTSTPEQKNSLDDFAADKQADRRTVFTTDTAITPSATFDASSLAGKSVLITGGASGLGEAALRAFVAAGAFVTIGDLADDRGAQLIAELGAEHVAFAHCDVTVWADQVKLFKTALAQSPQRTLDIVYANAGIGGGDDMMTDEVDAAGDPVQPKLKVLNVNLIGMFYTAKLAMHYLPKQPAVGTARDRCLIMTASMSGYLDHAGEPQYNSSKWGTRGLFRSLRNTLPKQDIRIGIIAPW